MQCYISPRLRKEPNTAETRSPNTVIAVFHVRGVNSFTRLSKNVFCLHLERKGRDMWWPILGICALHLTHPSVHTEQWVVNKHTPERWAFMLRCPGSRWGFGALLKGLTSVVVLKVEGTLIIHSPHRQFLLDLRFEPTASGYKSNTLSIRPRLPLGETATWTQCLIPLGYPDPHAWGELTRAYSYGYYSSKALSLVRVFINITSIPQVFFYSSC